MTQRHNGPRAAAHNWTELDVETRNQYDEVTSQTRFRSREGFVDISLEEYVGISRRAKYTSVRLEEPAALALLDLLCRALDPGRNPREATPGTAA